MEHKDEWYSTYPHSSGPWTHKGISIKDSNFEIVATVPKGTKALGERYSNAKLIAAAPDLLEALVKMSDDPKYQMGRCVYCRYGDGDHADDCPVIEAHTAIKKAT